MKSNVLNTSHSWYSTNQTSSPNLILDLPPYESLVSFLVTSPHFMTQFPFLIASHAIPCFSLHNLIWSPLTIISSPPFFSYVSFESRAIFYVVYPQPPFRLSVNSVGHLYLLLISCPSKRKSLWIFWSNFAT